LVTQAGFPDTGKGSSVQWEPRSCLWATPDLGEHIAEVHSRLCGYNDAQIDALRAEGVV